MYVSARFWVDEIKTRGYNPDVAEVLLRPTCRGDENKAWAKATPDGEIRLMINNPAAAQFFKDNQGKDVAITFEEVDMPTVSSQYEGIPAA